VGGAWSTILVIIWDILLSTYIYTYVHFYTYNISTKYANRYPKRIETHTPAATNHLHRVLRITFAFIQFITCSLQTIAACVL